MKKAIWYVVIVLVGMGILVALDRYAPHQEEPEVTNFDECVAAGNPVMESYPRQCRANDQTFVEEVAETPNNNLGGGGVGLANPASVFCTKNGGQLDMRENKQGQYGVCVFSDNSECEEWAFFRGECGLDKIANNLSQGESLQVAGSWVQQNAPTYLFDGSGLTLKKGITLTCPACFSFAFTFESSHGGYGDRTGQIVAQVITNHEIVVQVEQGEVVYAVTDGRFDEMSGTMLEE